ncbi:MAG: hypothetical protein BWX92_01590 [Deltaproteobacteria bacterium ADurb.Bin135]|nr:MAG: hypothetical protein BWX92_01590 [Deltaproteobacteria bacterium ADurb.Bin135]
MAKPKTGLENLLLLHGEKFLMESGYWVKIEAWESATTDQVPHGLRYTLTLHDRNNERILGYDNAHAIKPRRKRFAATKTTWDHIHRKRKIEPYEFESAEQLMVDFWEEVESFLKQGKE